MIAEQVSDLTYVQPEQVVPAPVQLPQAPFLGAIVQTDQGIVQLIAVERIRETSLGDLSWIREQLGTRSLESRRQNLRLEDPKSEIENPGSEL